MQRLLLTLAVLAIVGAPHVAQEPAQAPAPTGIDWKPHYAKALKLAKKENRPIMVAFILKGEAANEEICGEHFLDPRIVEMSKKFVCLLAFSAYGSADTSDSTENSNAMLSGMKDRVSPRQLKAIEMEARSDLLESSLVSTPQFIFLKPDGKTSLLRHVWTLSASELDRKMNLAYHFFDPAHPGPPGLKEEKKEVKQLLERCKGRNMVSRREALTELGAMDHPDVVEFLIKQTHKSVANQRRLEAIRAMGRKGGAKFLPALHSILRKEKSFQIRSNVADTLRQIGLQESAPHLIKLLKSEKKFNVRSLVLKALIACAPKDKDTQKVVKKLLRSGSDMDKMTLLYCLSSLPADPMVDKAVLKLMKSTDDNVRAAAYLVIGRHKLLGALRHLKGQLGTEKTLGRKACAWALNELDEKVSIPFGDPSSDISMKLPSAAY